MRDAEQRAWEVVRRAYEERAVTSRPARRRLLLVPAAAAVVAIAAIASPPGRAVFRQVREAVGVQHAEPALFSLPSKGRLLVVSAGHGGVWLVRDNGFKRRIGSYDDAQWSPHGLFVVATTSTELVALDVDHGVRWRLERKGAFAPRWEGTRIDTRIAYLTRGGLRVVAGDGTGDRLLDARALPIAPAWDPARLHTLAYVRGDAVVLREATGRVVWRTPVGARPSSLAWSSDGRYLAVASRRRIVVLGANGKLRRTVSNLSETIAGAAFRPGTHRLALATRKGGSSEVRVVDVDRPGHGRLLFAGPGAFGDIAWSPDGAWLLVGWPTADQWLFLHGSRVRAIANIREQFPRDDDVSPVLQFDGRWCCSVK